MSDDHSSRSNKKIGSASLFAVLGAVLSCAAAILAVVLQLVQSSGPLPSQATAVVWSAALLGGGVTVAGIRALRGIAEKRSKQFMRQTELTALFLARWEALESMLRSRIRGAGGEELPLRILLSRASEATNGAISSDLLYSLLSVRNSLVHKGISLSVEELEVTVAMLDNIEASIGEAVEHTVDDARKGRYPPEMSFQIARNERGKYWWRLTADGGQVAVSGEYDTLSEAMASIGAVRGATADASVRTLVEGSA